jgi:hypothetical protein
MITKNILTKLSLQSNNINLTRCIHATMKCFQENNSRPLKLMELPRTLVSNLLDPLKTILQISFNMLFIDPQFSSKDFQRGAQQVLKYFYFNPQALLNQNFLMH